MNIIPRAVGNPTSSSISFWINELPPSANAIKHLHWARYAEMVKRWTFLVNAASRDTRGNIPKAAEPCEVTVNWYLHKPNDVDNIHARCKPILDALVRNRIIRDDKPSIVAKLTCPQNIVRTRAETGVLIEIHAL